MPDFVKVEYKPRSFSIDRKLLDIPITAELLEAQQEIADEFADKRDAILAINLGMLPPLSRSARRRILKKSPDLLPLLESGGF
jgi:hypothetical protein